MNNDLSIPDFLKIDPADRKAAWIGRPFTSAWGGDVDARIKRDRQLRAEIEEERKAKSAESLARMKAQHAGEHWDAKKKMWWPD